jgi:hypothetical protein
MQQNVPETERWCRICNHSKDIGAFSLHTGKGRYICDDCKEPHRKEMRKKHSKNASNAIKQVVMQAYGGECSYCGDDCLARLQIDHMDGNGKAHREETGLMGPMLWYWLRDNSFPTKFQVLCKRCNYAKGTMSDQEFREWIRLVYGRLFKRK